MSADRRRRAGSIFACVTLAGGSALVTSRSAIASAPSAIQLGTWAAVRGGSSACRNVGATSVLCAHGYASHDLATGLETCTEAGLLAVGATTCHSSLAGYTSGPGRVVGDVAVACETKGVRTLSFSFGGASGSYPSFLVTASVDAGKGTFAGTSDSILLPGLGLVMQSANGTFTLGCGPGEPTLGSFSGSWTLVLL